MDFNNKIILGRTGLEVGRIGIASSFGAPVKAYEEAFEMGCNYFTWGTFIKGGSKHMRQAIKNIVAKGKRDDLIIALYSYSHISFLIEPLLKKDLKSLGIDYTDILILGYFQKPPGKRILSTINNLKERGLVRHFGVSSHNRNLFPVLEKEKMFDVFHLRYNAVNRGAEDDIFPFMNPKDRPGVVSYTATRWGQLLKQKNMPADIKAPSASDCYRFVLSNSNVDVCMMGTKTDGQMRENLDALKLGPLDEIELFRLKNIGDYLHLK